MGSDRPMSIETISYMGHTIECRRPMKPGYSWAFQPPIEMSGRFEVSSAITWARMAERKAAAARDCLHALGEANRSYAADSPERRLSEVDRIAGLGLFLALLALVPA